MDFWVIHGSKLLIWNLHCYELDKQNDNDIILIFGVILRAVFFLSDFEVLVVCQHFSTLFNACFMHDLVGTPRQENCLLRVTLFDNEDKFFSFLYFFLPSIWSKLAPRFFCCLFLQAVIFPLVTFILKPFILFMVSFIFYFEVWVWLWKLDLSVFFPCVFWKCTYPLMLD